MIYNIYIHVLKWELFQNRSTHRNAPKPVAEPDAPGADNADDADDADNAAQPATEPQAVMGSDLRWF